MLKTVTKHYVKHGCTVTICALDTGYLSKAFDREDRYAILKLLMEAAAIAKEFHCCAGLLYVMLVFARKARYDYSGIWYCVTAVAAMRHMMRCDLHAVDYYMQSLIVVSLLLRGLILAMCVCV